MKFLTAGSVHPNGKRPVRTGMNRRLLAVRIVLLSLTAGCTDSGDLPGAGNETICIAVSPEPFATRTAMSGHTASFTTGDKIGIFETVTRRNNVAYTYGSPYWSTPTPMYWKNPGPHVFYAYYPYQAAYSNMQVTIPVLAGQKISATPDPACDLLWSTLTQTKTAVVTLPFNHVFSLLKFNVSFGSALLASFLPNQIIVGGGNAANGSQPYGMFNRVNDYTQIAYNLASQTVTFSASNASVFQQSITAAMPTLASNAATLYVLVVPGTYTNPAPYVQFTVKALLGVLTFTTKATNLPAQTFAPGAMYEYNVQVLSLPVLSTGTPVPFHIAVSRTGKNACPVSI